MFENASYFLDRFRSLKPPERFVKEGVVGVVKSACGINLRDIDVSVKRGIVYINTSPAAKSEIVLHKQLILKKLSKEMIGMGVKDIR